MHSDRSLWVVYGIRLVDSPEYRYVGLTRQGASERLRQHISNSRTLATPAARWITKHCNELAIDILEDCPENDLEYLCEAEQYWISQIRWFGHRLLNMSPGGASGCYGVKWTLRPEQIRAGERHPRYGHKNTEEAKRIVSEKKRGVPSPSAHIRYHVKTGKVSDTCRLCKEIS